MAGYYALKRSGTQFMFNLKAGNDETILTNERHTTKRVAEGGIDKQPALVNARKRTTVNVNKWPSTAIEHRCR